MVSLSHFPRASRPRITMHISKLHAAIQNQTQVYAFSSTITRIVSYIRCLDSLAVALDALLTGLLGPWEVSDWNDEKGVALVCNTREGIVPGDEGSEKSKHTTGLDQCDVNLSGIVQDKVSNSQEEEGHVESEEQQEEGDGRAECAEEEESGEDEPSSEEESNSMVKIVVRVLLGVSSGDGEATWGVDDGVRDPETSVRRESSSTESVSDGHFPVTLLACVRDITKVG